MLYSLAGIVLLAAAALSALFVLAPTDLIRERLVAEVKAKTGRDLIIGGSANFSIYPSVGITVTDVSLSAPSGMRGPAFVRMAGLDVTLAAWPLLSRQVIVERLVLRDPVFDIRVDASGRKSWDKADAASGTDGSGRHLVRLAQAARKTLDDSQRPAELTDFSKSSSQPQASAVPVQVAALAGIEGLALGDVRIVNGTVNYTDERTNSAEDLTEINVSIGLKSLSSPMTASGTFTARREPLALDAKVGALDKALSGQMVKLDLKLTGKPLNAVFDGQTALRAGGETEGKLTLTSPSAAGLLRYLGKGVADMPGLGPLELTSLVKAGDTSVAFNDSDLRLDGTTAKGRVAAQFGALRPLIKANLVVSELDLNRYMPVANAIARAPTVVPVRARAAAAPPALKPAQSIGDLIEQTAVPPAAVKVKGYTAVAGWSDEAIDLAALNAVDIEAKLSLGRLLHQNFKIGQSQTTVVLKGGILRTSIDDMLLYDGRGRGLITLDATTPQASIGANISADGIAAAPLLKDAAAMDWLSGKGRLNLAIAGRGQSQRQLMETLTGKADFALADGAVAGFNLPQILRGLSQGRISGLERTPTEKTDFSDFTASFTLTNGVAQNQDLRITSPLIRVGGAGSVNLAQRTLDYTIRPKLVASLDGQGGQQGASGLEIPVKITGGWDKPKIAPDIDGLLKDPSKAIEAVKEIGKQFKGKSADEIVRSITGGQVQGPDGQPLKPRQLLDQFLKR